MNIVGVFMKGMVINWERPANFKAVQCRFTKPAVTRCQTSLWFFFPWIICWLSYSLNKYSVFYSVIWDPADRRFNFLNAIFAARHDWVTMKLQSSSNKGMKWSSRFFNSGVKIHQLLQKYNLLEMFRITFRCWKNQKLWKMIEVFCSMTDFNQSKSRLFFMINRGW